VRALRERVADRLAARLREATGVDERARRELGRALVEEEIASWADSRVMVGEDAPDAAEERALAAAVFASLFGLGRLQPLVDEPGVENIEINGCDQVWLCHADGRIERGAPVADSDAELVALLQQVAARAGRALSTADPRLHLALPDGSRLAAMIATVPRPQVVIRRHRARDSTLDELVGLGTLDELLAEFLGACVLARKNIIVTGRQNAGKTTLVGALAHEIHPLERFATIEREYELFLHEMPDRHPRVVAMQAREAVGETGADGRPAGEVSVRELVADALRMNLTRIIVGEARGDEALPMLQAMTTGDGGSLCTVHARSARHAVERLVTLCLMGPAAGGPPGRMSDVFAYRLFADAVDFIVHIRMVDETHLGGARHRFVNEILEVTGVGEGGRPATNQIFGPGADGRAAPRHNPACLDDLRRAGLDLNAADHPDGLWTRPLDTVLDPRWAR
jgi:Flp pilus assembly CpaF family ATPase